MPVNKPEVVGGDSGDSLIRFLKGIRVPGWFKGVGGLLVFVGIVGLIALMTCFTYIRPNEFGIKEVRIGTDRGIQEKVYGPGFAFQLPFGLQIIHRFPKNVQVLELSSVPNTGDLASDTHTYDRAAKIQTSDGFYVDVDVTILYRIVNPYEVFINLGTADKYLIEGILPKAEPILKQALGVLTTEDFYNSPLRSERADLARDLLDEELRDKGMQVDHVLVRYFMYSEEIQRNIEEKKLQDQNVFKNQSEERAAKEAAELKRVAEEGEARVKVTLEEGEAYKVTRAAETDLYVRKNKAEADLLIELAEARRTEMRNEAMQTLGVEKAVAMKMAEVMAGLDSIVVPIGGDNGFNPLDLDSLVTLFGATQIPSDVKTVTADSDGATTVAPEGRPSFFFVEPEEEPAAPPAEAAGGESPGEHAAEQPEEEVEQ